MGHFRATYLILIVIIVTPFLFIMQSIFILFGVWQETIPQFYHKFIVKLIGLQIVQYGKPSKIRPLLIVSNHVSWLDIIVISSSTKVCFVAKKEVSKWPIFGALAKLQRTVFIERSIRQVVSQRKEMMRRLSLGQRLSLFPEGTSSDGKSVLPFKSSLFSLAEMRPNGKPLNIQPVSIAYIGLNGLPISINDRTVLAWFGEMSLISHIWGVLTAGPAKVALIFHNPINFDQFNSRKELAFKCEKIVSKGLTNAMSGKFP
ncbi:1-acyl-sn-glycerol-3-phosphate acyltransferase [Alphaproteobacteria bacterium]|nr:1-acyl-sn-glycerol-3-phosphate acyltransferase [Alphaproteobacteria bacterium]